MSGTKQIMHRPANPKGMIILVTGPNGLEKTTTAKALTTPLTTPFRHIHTARIIGRYIGETEKNLGRILAAGLKTKTTLFFDEADALFGKRTQVSDSHDRYANQEISYLLQQLQTYPGIIILATNRKSHVKKVIRDNVNYVVQVIATTGNTPRRSSTSSRAKK